MKLSTLALAFIGFSSIGHSQLITPEDYAVEIEPLVITNTPGIHSYSWAKDDQGRWLIVGGRIDGLHQRQPFAAFLEADNNKFAFVIDPINEQSWSADLSVLNAGLFEQLQSTNQEFYQRDTTLYVFGGYGFSATSSGHITYPNITAIDINGLTQAIVDNASVTPYFRQITDTRMKVTGGQIGYLDSMFYLVGGQLFDGSYNPMGPDHGPGFTQDYTDEIRSFKLEDNGTTMSIVDYGAQTDSVNLHRRDYNMAPQIFPNGDFGFTAFSGVFDPNDLPYLNSVDITPAGYTVNNAFNQFLSQYHSAKISVYDSTALSNQTLFFGGMSQFYFDGGTLIEDTDVPFIKTISKVTRFNDGSMNENALTYLEMPALLGAGSEFIPTGDYLIEGEILDINAIPNQKTLIGYIYGGIESSDKNIFFINDGTQSSASNTIFKVYINKSIAGYEEQEIIEDLVQNMNVFPNPAKKEITIQFTVPKLSDVHYDIISTDGKIVKKDSFGILENGIYDSEIDIRDLESGNYIVQLFNGEYLIQYKFIKK
jgi:Secretion system C-terminal sorting domain